MLLQELTHHALYIDELRYSHYDYSGIANQSTWARSAILNIARPLDKVLHSVVVSMEILLLREQYLGHPTDPRVHPPTPIMRSQLVNAIASIEAVIFGETWRKHQFFRPRAMDILYRVKQHLSKIKTLSHKSSLT